MCEVRINFDEVVDQVTELCRIVNITIISFSKLNSYQIGISSLLISSIYTEFIKNSALCWFNL